MVPDNPYTFKILRQMVLNAHFAYLKTETLLLSTNFIFLICLAKVLIFNLNTSMPHKNQSHQKMLHLRKTIQTIMN